MWSQSLHLSSPFGFPHGARLIDTGGWEAPPTQQNYPNMTRLDCLALFPPEMDGLTRHAPWPPLSAALPLQPLRLPFRLPLHLPLHLYSLLSLVPLLQSTVRLLHEMAVSSDYQCWGVHGQWYVPNKFSLICMFLIHLWSNPFINLPTCTYLPTYLPVYPRLDMTCFAIQQM